MVNLSLLVCLIYFTFLKIYQNMTATNSANTIKLRNLFHSASNPRKIFFCLRFYVTALFEKSELIRNWIINQHQFISVLESINKRFLNFLTFDFWISFQFLWYLTANFCTPSPPSFLESINIWSSTKNNRTCSYNS